MEVVGSKVLVMFLLGIFCMLLGFIPLKLGNWFRNRDGSPRHGTILSSLLCFGGGILLATSLIHMLPELRESFEEADIVPEGKEIPLAEIFLVVGFFLIYFIEEFVHSTCDSKLHHHQHDEPQCEELKCEEQCEEQREQTLAVHRAFTVQTQACVSDHNDLQKEKGENNQNSRKSSLRNSISSANNATGYQTFENNGNQNDIMAVSHQDDCVTAPKGGRKIALRDFFTVLALSFHSVFEGLAIGLEPTTDHVILLFAAIASHKYIIAFCIGLELHNANTPICLYIVYMIVFSLMSPLGIGIGIAVTSAMEDQSTAYTLSVAILQAIAAGTLLYVCVFEILEREKSKENVPGLLQLLFVILGFCTLLTVSLLLPEPHEDDADQGKDDLAYCINLLNGTSFVWNQPSIQLQHLLPV